MEPYPYTPPRRYRVLKIVGVTALVVTCIFQIVLFVQYGLKSRELRRRFDSALQQQNVQRAQERKEDEKQAGRERVQAQRAERAADIERFRKETEAAVEKIIAPGTCMVRCYPAHSVPYWSTRELDGVLVDESGDVQIGADESRLEIVLPRRILDEGRLKTAIDKMTGIPVVNIGITYLQDDAAGAHPSQRDPG